MDLPRNRFKHAIAEGRLQIGLWSTLGSTVGAEILGDSGFDWLLLDTEHSPNELPDLLAQMQALGRSETAPIVRPAWNDTVLIKRILDIGAQSVLLPYVQNAGEAASAVAATRYPPAGVRGVTGSGRAARYGRVRDYAKRAHEELCVLVQVETRQALGNWRLSPASTGSMASSSARPTWRPRWASSASRGTRKCRPRSRTPRPG